MKTAKLNREKLAALLPVLEVIAKSTPYSFAEVRSGRDSVQVLLPVPGSSFPVDVSGDVKYGSAWKVEITSGSWRMEGSNLSLAEQARLYSQVMQLAASIASLLETVVDLV